MGTRHLQRLKPSDSVLQIGDLRLDERDSVADPLRDHRGLGRFEGRPA